MKYVSPIVATATNLQICVSLSSTVAEYVKLSEAFKTTVRIRNVLNELCFEQESTSIHHDNTGCIEWATGGAESHCNKRKHIYI